MGGDKRREEDADWGKKTYRGIDTDGNAWKKAKTWFGFRVHLIVDADAELPVSYTQKEYGIVSTVIREGQVLNQEYEDNEVLLRVRIPAPLAGKLAK